MRKNITETYNSSNVSTSNVNPQIALSEQKYEEAKEATEKALLDLLYLTPSLKSEEDMLQLRLDEDFMVSEFDKEQARQFLARFNSKALNRRFDLLQKIYVND